VNRDARKLAAALAAVNAFLQDEAQATAAVVAAPAVPTIWSVAGRIALMNARAGTIARARR